MSQTLSLSAKLPIIGAKTYSFPIPDDAVLDEVESLNGGKVTASAAVTKSPDGVSITLTFDLPVIGAKTVTEDIKTEGIAQEGIDDLLALDGGTVELDAMLSEAA